jgi:Glycosyl transferase family 64 domain
MQRRQCTLLDLTVDIANGDDSNGAKQQYCEGNDTTVRRLVRNWSQNRRIVLRFLSLLFLFVVGFVLPITRTLGIRILPKKLKTAESVVPKTHIRYPPVDIQISVVIMNHARPNLLQHSQLLPVLTHHPSVSEILILHSNPATSFTNAELQHLGDEERAIQKIQHLDVWELNSEMGLAVRFHYCAVAATNDWVMHLDDDMELDASAVSELVWAMIDNSHRIVGHFGRTYNYWKAPLRYGYDTKDHTGRVEVVLTKALILEKQVCAEFWKHAALMNDMVSDSKPRWNGEDIFVNLVANHYYSVPLHGPYNNYAIADLNVWEADVESFPENIPKVVEEKKKKEEVSVSGNMDRNRIWIVGPVAWWKANAKAQSHTAYRGRLWYRAKQRLAALQD